MAVIGGTGDEGYGLALRWAKHGHQVYVGSRSLERAESAAKAIAGLAGPHSHVVGLVNPDAVEKADIIVIAVPFGGLAETIKAIKPSLRPGHVIVNVTVPLETSVGGRATRTLGVWAGSAAEFIQGTLPRGVKVVSAFNNVSAEALNDLTRNVECDILVCGDDDEDKRTVFSLIEALPAARAIDAGSLSNSRTVEQLTALLVGINIRYGVKSAGLRITGLSLS